MYQRAALCALGLGLVFSNLGFTNSDMVKDLKSESCAIYGEAIVGFLHKPHTKPQAKALVQDYFLECVDPDYYDLMIPINNALTIERG